MARGRPHLNAASLLSRQKESQNLPVYSLKTKTRVCPAKRTSFTWPVSLSRTESYADLLLRSSQRPSDSATTSLPFCTVALLPSIMRRYSPARRSALPIFEACASVMVLVNGLANAGTATAMAASRARLRTKELVFMRVIYPFTRNQVSAMEAEGWSIDTRSKDE